MQLELRHPRAIGPKPMRKPVIDLNLFSQRHGLSEDVARRIISTSRTGDQARSSVELRKSSRRSVSVAATTEVETVELRAGTRTRSADDVDNRAV
jgi:hypothetical protein